MAIHCGRLGQIKKITGAKSRTPLAFDAVKSMFVSRAHDPNSSPIAADMTTASPNVRRSAAGCDPKALLMARVITPAASASTMPSMPLPTSTSATCTGVTSNA